MKREICFKWFVVTLLLAVFGLSAEAEGTDDVTSTGGDKMVIEFQSGESLTYELDEKPLLLFLKDALTIKSDVMEEILSPESYDYSNIKKIYFMKSSSTSLNEIENMQEKTVSVKFIDSNTFEVYGIDGKSVVNVYSLDGKMMPLDADRSDNAVMVHLSGYKNGTYIIKIGKRTYKVMKR